MRWPRADGERAGSRGGQCSDASWTPRRPPPLRRSARGRSGRARGKVAGRGSRPSQPRGPRPLKRQFSPTRNRGADEDGAGVVAEAGGAAAIVHPRRTTKRRTQWDRRCRRWQRESSTSVEDGDAAQAGAVEVAVAGARSSRRQNRRCRSALSMQRWERSHANADFSHQRRGFGDRRTLRGSTGRRSRGGWRRTRPEEGLRREVLRGHHGRGGGGTRRFRRRPHRRRRARAQTGGCETNPQRQQSSGGHVVLPRRDLVGADPAGCQATPPWALQFRSDEREAMTRLGRRTRTAAPRVPLPSPELEELRREE